MNASFEHEFNNHSCCGSWCKYAKLPPAEWKTLNAQSGCKLRDKVLDAHMYLEAKAVHEQFTTDENLEMLNHLFDSQKNEAMNKAFTKVAPKNMVFSKSKSLSDHLCLVIAYDSLGYYEMMNCVMQSLTENPDYELDPLIKSWAMQLDKEREQKRKRQQSVSAKGDRCAKRKANLQTARVHEGLAQLAGHFYEHGKAFKGASEHAIVDDDDMN